MKFPASVARVFILLALPSMLLTGSCATVELGDNPPPPELQLDEDFFYCRIQPEVLTAQSCASGGPGEDGSCHSARSALRLSVAAETDPPPTCQGDRAVGPVPASYIANFAAIQFTVQADPLSSALFRRPINLDSHPRQIYAVDSVESTLVRDWITAGAR
ncbi:MAG: hypothetical protein AAGF12_17600 [Myxococcota bacterium]